MTALARIQFEASLSSLTFTVPVEPRGWARARRRGGTYFLDPETVAFRNAVIAFATQAMVRHSAFDEAVAMTVISILSIPASWSRTRRAAALAGTIRPTAKPDVDNLAKGVCDALNGIVYRDDAQVVDLRSIKFYGARPEVQVAVSPIREGSIAGR
jgi:Holliday junction resolvase RusA-like endonuclease